MGSCYKPSGSQSWLAAINHQLLMSRSVRIALFKYLLYKSVNASYEYQLYGVGVRCLWMVLLRGGWWFGFHASYFFYLCDECRSAIARLIGYPLALA